MRSKCQVIIIARGQVNNAITTIRSILGLSGEPTEEWFTVGLRPEGMPEQPPAPFRCHTINTTPDKWALIAAELPAAEFYTVDERAEAFDGKGTRTPWRHGAKPKWGWLHNVIEQ